MTVFILQESMTRHLLRHDPNATTLKVRPNGVEVD